MTTRISQEGPISTVNVALTAHRTTLKPATSFKSVLGKSALGRSALGGASTLAGFNAANAAVRRLPGGEMLAAAARSGIAGAAPVVAQEGAAVENSASNPR